MAQPLVKKDDDRDDEGRSHGSILCCHKAFSVKRYRFEENGLFDYKGLSPSADEVIIVTSSLMKDMNSKTDMYQANAIRVLCRITDGTFLTQIERYLKQAIVDKNPVVASAALVSGIHLLQRL